MDKIALPTILGGIRIKVVTGCGNMYIHFNWYQGKLYEVFATLGRGGDCGACEMEALTRSISLGLRCGVSLEEYISQLREIRCPNSVPFPKEVAVKSCPDAVAKALSTYGLLSIDKVVELFYRVNGHDALLVNPGAPPVGASEEQSEEAVAAQMTELAKQREAQGLYT